jgi:hypothetical protein
MLGLGKVKEGLMEGTEGRNSKIIQGRKGEQMGKK